MSEKIRTIEEEQKDIIAGQNKEVRRLNDEAADRQRHIEDLEERVEIAEADAKYHERAWQDLLSFVLGR